MLRLRTVLVLERQSIGGRPIAHVPDCVYPVTYIFLALLYGVCAREQRFSKCLHVMVLPVGLILVVVDLWGVVHTSRI